MDVGRGGVDVVMAHERLDHGEVDARLGQRGAEAVAQRMGVPGGDAGLGTVVAEHGPQPRRGERLATMRTLGDDEHPAVLVVSGRSASR